MSNATVEITFGLYVGADICASENELSQNLKSFQEQLLLDEFYNGKLTIRFANNFLTELEDEFPPLVKNLCFFDLPEFLKNQHYVYNFWGYHGCLRLDLEGTTVRLSGDYTSTLRLPVKEFASELHRCGERFINILEKLQSCDPVVERKMIRGNLIQFLSEERNTAGEALSRLLS